MQALVGKGEYAKTLYRLTAGLLSHFVNRFENRCSLRYSSLSGKLRDRGSHELKFCYDQLGFFSFY